MIGKDSSYFHPALCAANPHYIVAGRTNDLFCTDELQLVEVEMVLHHHLRREQGFDAVFFLDLDLGLYCLDEQSRHVLTHNRLPAGSPPPDGGLDFSRFPSGPFGRGRRRRQPATPPEPTPDAAAGPPLHMGGMSLERAWDQVASFMKKTDLRCALVLNNVGPLLDAMLTPRQVNTLTQFEAFSGAAGSIVIYLFRGDSQANLAEAASSSANPAWANLYNLVLKPGIEAEQPEDNRVITLGPPNAAETRNLLNHLRLRSGLPRQSRCAVRGVEIGALARELAASCCRNNQGLTWVLERITAYCARTGGALGLDNWREALDDRCRPALERLDALVGLDRVKRHIHAWHERMSRRTSGGAAFPARSSRFSAPPAALNDGIGHSLNVQLRGGPGSGKSTVAGLFGELYRDLGLLPQGHTVSVTAGDIVSGHVGGTFGLLRQRVLEAQGGVLFIDEAYALAGDAHGRQAINQLVADMTGYERQFAVVVAGYSRDIERLMAQNEGLARRFPEFHELPDYTGPEMRILLERAAEKAEERPEFGSALREGLDDFCENWVAARPPRGWGNAAEAETLMNAMINNAGRRMAESGDHGPLVLEPADLPEALRAHLKPLGRNLESAIEIVNRMIGLANIKAFLWGLCDDAHLRRTRSPGNFIFHGPPGTGKTTVARSLAEILYLVGALPSPRLRECPAGRLTDQRDDREGRPMSIAEAVDEELDSARGGLLFIDEAHQLAAEHNDRGRQAIQALVARLGNDKVRADVCVVCAGYSKEMLVDFLSVDSGLESRFPRANRIRFENYTARELRDILKKMAEDDGEVPEEAYLDRAEIALGRFLERQPANFGNGRYIRETFLPGSRAARRRRLLRRYAGPDADLLNEAQAARIPEAERRALTAEDIPEALVGLAGPAGLRPPPEEPDARRLAESLLVGKQQVKDYVRTLVRPRVRHGEAPLADARSAAGLHVALGGPNGSGRHTVAGVLARVWKKLGLLETGTVRIANSGNLVGRYRGHTAGQTRAVIEDAAGGVLVVEHPSAMLPSGDGREDDFGPEALRELAAAMQRTDLAVVLLDSEDGLERLFQANSMFRSCLAKRFSLEAPTPEDMEALFRLQTREAMTFDPDLDELLPDFFQNWVSDRGGSEDGLRGWGNALELPGLIDEITCNWQLRRDEANGGGETRTEEIEENGRTVSMTRRLVTAAMFPERVARYLRPSRAAASQALDGLAALPGLARVKEAVERIRLRIEFAEAKNRVRPGGYCFVGNPGTGKTAVARLMGGILRAVGALDKGHVIERPAQRMAARMAESADSFDKDLTLAKGGVLFIDDVHQLAGSGAGQAAARALAAALVDSCVTRDVCIILAGRPAETARLFDLDSDLARRFGRGDSLVRFDDFTPGELLEIMNYMAGRADEIEEIGVDRPLELTEAFRSAALAVFRHARSGRDERFGNAAFVRDFLHDAAAEMRARLTRLDFFTRDQARTLTGEDIPGRFRGLAVRETVSLPRAEPAAAPFGPAAADDPAFLDYCRRRTVYLELLGEDGTVIGQGSGCIVTAAGHVLTCNHVAAAATTMRARVHTPGAVGGDARWHDCEVLEPRFKDCDMALLRLSGANFPAAAVRPPGKPVREGETTLMPGFPLGAMLAGGNAENLACSFFRGGISSVHTMPDGIQRCYLDSRGLHGNSGSPVFSLEDGSVIGVFSGSVLPRPGENPDELNFFHPARYFWERFVALGEEAA